MLSKSKFFVSVAILIGTCIGAGVLGIPYIAAQAGFFVVLAYILILGGLILTINLYLGEISLRTKGDHQLVGYAKKYLGNKGRRLMEFSIVFGIYSAIVAYALGIGRSFSFLIFGNFEYGIIFGVLFGIFMASLLWKGIDALKKYEKIGVGLILILLLVIFAIFFKEVNYSNFAFEGLHNVLLPFGVILFSLLAFHSIPEIRIVLHKNEKLMKRSLIFGTLICIVFYVLFAFVVVGFKGLETPEIATLALGPVFIFMGILTMFTSWLSLGNALDESLIFDEKSSKFKSWFYSAILPLGIFLAVTLSDFFSFTKILSIGGVISGGLSAILILLIVKRAKIFGDRKPEYSVPVNWFVIGFMVLIFAFGILREIYLALR